MPFPLSTAQFESLDAEGQSVFLREQQRLTDALENRLKVLAQRSDERDLDVQIAINDIFADLGRAQDKLRPMTLAYDKAIREWKMGKKPYSSSFGHDFAAA